jgi:hypothetical protein
MSLQSALWALAGFLTMTFAGQALAETFNVTVPAGKQKVLWTRGSVDSVTCATNDAAVNAFRIMREPTHGSVAITTITSTFKGTNGPSPCDGKPFKPAALVYTPAKGFKGTDSLVIERMVRHGRMETYDPAEMIITVK